MDIVHDLKIPNEAVVNAGPKEVAQHVFSIPLDQIPEERYWQLLGGVDDNEMLFQIMVEILIYGTVTLYPTSNLLDLDLSEHLGMMKKVQKYFNHICFDFAIDEKDLNIYQLRNFNDYYLYLGHTLPPFMLNLDGQPWVVDKYSLCPNPNWKKPVNTPIEDYVLAIYNPTIKKLFSFKFRVLRINFVN